MAQEIKELIEKINQEAVLAAEKKARDIEGQAASAAREIIAKAKEEAGVMIAEAKTRARQEEERTRALLAQAGRDMLLTLRKEINAMLERLLLSEAASALGASDLQRVITEVVKTFGEQQKGEVVIHLKKSDLDVLENKILGKLKEETKKGIALKTSQDIRAGFTISFDAGKSHFDFTDKAFAEYIGQYLKPKLNKILTR